MWVLTDHHNFRAASVLSVVPIAGNTCEQPTMFSTIKTCKAMAADACSLLNKLREGIEAT